MNKSAQNANSWKLYTPVSGRQITSKRALYGFLRAFLALVNIRVNTGSTQAFTRAF
jgi:hypothetical protein